MIYILANQIDARPFSNSLTLTWANQIDMTKRAQSSTKKTKRVVIGTGAVIRSVVRLFSSLIHMLHPPASTHTHIGL